MMNDRIKQQKMEQLSGLLMSCPLDYTNINCQLKDLIKMLQHTYKLPNLFIIFFISTACAGQQKKEANDFSNPVVLMAPIDTNRVNAIVPMLSSQPAGFGAPISDRKIWDKLKSSGKYEHILTEADKLLVKGFPEWDEDGYMAFFTRGNSQIGKEMNMRRVGILYALTMSECIDNQGKYIPAVEKWLDKLIAQKTWVHPRFFNPDNPVGYIELSAANYASHIAQTLYLLGEKLNPEIKARAKAELYTRIFKPFMHTFAKQSNDHYWLTVTHNWNAVCLSGVTIAALTVIEDPKERAVFVAIAERYIKNYVAGFFDDGYCTEGLMYFSYGFAHYIALREKLLQSTNGKLDIFNDNHKINAISRFVPNLEIINNVYPAIADCNLGTKPSELVMFYLNKTQNLGLKMYANLTLENTEAYLILDLVNSFPISSAEPNRAVQKEIKQNELSSWFKYAGILTVRPLTSHKHTMGVNMKGGTNNEHHNHNDLGSFSIVVGNELMAGDPGAIPYTAKTFSKDRYTYKSIGSYGHPVPLVAGKEQIAGASAQAKILKTDFSEKSDVIKMDITSAYNVPELKTITREFSYSRTTPEKLQISDVVEFSSPQFYETAVITRAKWRQIAPDKLILEGKSEKLLISISGSLGNISVKNEEICEENCIPYTRLSFGFNQPVGNGKIKLTFTPLSK